MGSETTLSEDKEISIEDIKLAMTESLHTIAFTSISLSMHPHLSEEIRRPLETLQADLDKACANFVICNEALINACIDRNNKQK